MEKNLGFLTLLLPRSPDLDVSAVFRRGQSQQVSSPIQHTSWQVKINGISLPASPSSFPLAAGCSPSPEPPSPAIVWKICTSPVYKSLKPLQWGEEKKFSFLAILEQRPCVQGAPWQGPLEWFCSSICSICSCSADRTPSQEGCSSLPPFPVKLWDQSDQLCRKQILHVSHFPVTTSQIPSRKCTFIYTCIAWHRHALVYFSPHRWFISLKMAWH